MKPSTIIGGAIVASLAGYEAVNLLTVAPKPKTVTVTAQGKLAGSYERFVFESTTNLLSTNWTRIASGTNRVTVVANKPCEFIRCGIESDIFPNL
jgi:hypothetical protein